MIKEKSKADRVKGHTYGKLSFLPAKLTCYHKHSGSKTPPPPTGVIDGPAFKKMLYETVDSNMSPKTLDDVTSMYTKHAAAPTDSVAVHTQSIILDVISYFYHRAQEGQKPTSSQHEGGAKCSNPDANRNDNIEVHEKRPPIFVGAPVDTSKDRTDVSGSAQATGVQGNEPNINDDASGNTLVVASSGEECSSTLDSFTDTVKGSQRSSQQVYLSEGLLAVQGLVKLPSPSVSPNIAIRKCIADCSLPCIADRLSIY